MRLYDSHLIWCFKMVWSVLIFETVMNSVRPIGEFSYPDFPVGAVINWRNASIAFLGNLFLVNFSFCWCLIDGIASAYLQSSLVWRRVAILACGVFDTIEIYSATIKKMSIWIGSSVFLILWKSLDITGQKFFWSQIEIGSIDLLRCIDYFYLHMKHNRL